jgi:SpoVK/Ycf46/Vps4 family AAA+-type ATPase
MPTEDDTRMELLRKYVDTESSVPNPILSPEVETTLESLIQEREQADLLAKHGLEPSKSAIFVGAPGLGKTISARWVASRLKVPLYVLDLSAVMSSLLGRSGVNLKKALDFAKQTPCVLLLDEIDAIAKRRSDESDVGELKRLVTVILQEVDDWPSSGLLLAATNHPELIDPALWRRFDAVIEFKAPSVEGVQLSIKRFLGADLKKFQSWLEPLACILHGESFSNIEREIRSLRRCLVIQQREVDELVIDLVKTRCSLLDKQDQLKIAIHLDTSTKLSQRRVSEITGVSRDTIRKHRANV